MITIKRSYLSIHSIIWIIFDMRSIYCTLFNQNYLIKGIALYRSMERSIPEFHLYILAMDEETQRVLGELRLEKATIIDRNSVVDEHLKGILDNRSGASLFWTCTPLIIEYVLAQLGEEWCTYVDADCFFFGDPQDVFAIMDRKNYSVGIVEHRFRKDESYNSHVESDGRFNVAFNVFRNETNSLKILDEWKNQCIEQCTNKPIEGYFGDQLYLNEWPDKYERVYIIENEGIDVAPWNVNNYHVISCNGDYIIENDKVYEKILMYHFHTFNRVSNHIVSLNLWNTKKRSKTRGIFAIYKDYYEEYKRQELLSERFLRTYSNDSKIRAVDKIKLLYEKYHKRKEKSIVQLIRNIMWV